MRKRHQFVVGLIALYGAFSFLNTNSKRTVFLRRLAGSYIHSVYATDGMLRSMPPLPPESTRILPSYLTLCREWIRRDITKTQQNGENQSSTFGYLELEEDDAVCLDWSAPHFRLLEMHAALIISNQMENVIYRHNCERTRSYNQMQQLGFDYTTIQQVLDVFDITAEHNSNKHLLKANYLKQQCRRCLLHHDPVLESAQIKSRAFHHCLAFPDESPRERIPKNIPLTPNNNTGLAPISLIVSTIRKHIFHAALQWKNATITTPDSKPVYEETSGTVIYLDHSTVPLPTSYILDVIDPAVSSITILASPACAVGRLLSGRNCRTYAEDLKTVFLRKIHKFHVSPHGVKVELFYPSTAAAYSRMVLAKDLICLPRTPSCLFAALAKSALQSRAIVFDDPHWFKATDFFTIMGNHGSIELKVVASDVIPPFEDRARRLSNHQVPLPILAEIPQQFAFVTAKTNDEGYTFAPLRYPTDRSINELSDGEILNFVDQKVSPLLENPHLHHRYWAEQGGTATSRHATQQQSTTSLDDSNLGWSQGNTKKYNNNNGGIDQYRHGELATDADVAGVPKRGTNVEYQHFERESAKRAESLKRIKNLKHQQWETSVHGLIQHVRQDVDPNTLYKVHCPNGTSKGALGQTIYASSKGVVAVDPPLPSQGIEVAPPGTSFRQQDGTNVWNGRRVVTLKEHDFPFTQEIYRLCNQYKTKKTIVSGNAWSILD